MESQSQSPSLPKWGKAPTFASAVKPPRELAGVQEAKAWLQEDQMTMLADRALESVQSSHLELCEKGRKAVSLTDVALHCAVEYTRPLTNTVSSQHLIYCMSSQELHTAMV